MMILCQEHEEHQVSKIPRSSRDFSSSKNFCKTFRIVDVTPQEFSLLVVKFMVCLPIVVIRLRLRDISILLVMGEYVKY
jgi:hypothetical protein